MIPIRIDDQDDPRIAAYRDIRERDLVGRRGRFVAEGKVVLDVLFSSGRFAAESALILESRLEGAGAVLAKAPADLPVYVASQAVMDAIAGFHMHRGILAVGLKGEQAGCEALLDGLGPQALVVALVGIANHDNVGSIFRNAAAFEADAILLDPTCCDPLYRKAIRVSVGAALRTPFAAAESAQALMEALERRGFEMIGLSPRGEDDIVDLAPGGRRALFLGAEGEGLPPALLSRMRTVRIGMSSEFDSLNVASASAVALHRLWRGAAS